MEGPGAIYPAKVSNLHLAADLPPVHEEAAIHAQIRATNPDRGDRQHMPTAEALFCLPRKAPCALCGAEDLEQLSSLYSSCAHSVCSVCYTVTHQANSGDGPPNCSVRCGGFGEVRPEEFRVVRETVEFAPATLSM